MSIESEYIRRCASRSDINEHMPVLSALASECVHVTEFGVRSGNSTVAILHGLPTHGRLVSYDRDQHSSGISDSRWEFRQANTSRLSDIDETDMLFVDTLHTFMQVKAELAHGNRASKYLVFHDVVLFGTSDEGIGGPPGIMPAIKAFMHNNPNWVIHEMHENNNGLLVLKRKNQ